MRSHASKRPPWQRHPLTFALLLAACAPWSTPPVDPPAAAPCEGDVTLGSAAELEAFAAAGCAAVSGSLRISGDDIAAIDLPALLTVEALEIVDNPILGAASMSSLLAVPTGRSCCFKGDMCGGCQGGLLIQGNPRLRRIDLASLFEAGSLEISDNAVLETLPLPSLQAVDRGASLGGAQLAGLRLAGNGSLTLLEAPLLASVPGAELSSNASLAGLHLGALWHVEGELRVVENPSLPACQPLAILERSRSIGHHDRALVTGNAPPGTCPSLSVCAGPQAIPGPGGWAELSASGCVEVAGDLTVGGGGEGGRGELPGLARIDGQLAVSGDLTLVEAAFPALAVVNGGVAVTGSRTLRALELPALATLEGDFTVTGNERLEALLLPRLGALIGFPGAIIAENPALSTISLPGLTTLERAEVSRNGSLAVLELPALSVLYDGGALEISGNPHLQALTLPRLARARAWVTLSGNAALKRLELPALAEAWEVTITGNGLAGELTLPALEIIHDLTVGDEPTLVRLNLPALPVLSSTEQLGTLFLSGNEALQAVSAPLLRAGNLDVAGNASLAALEFPVLAEGTVKVARNAVLAAVLLPALTSGDGQGNPAANRVWIQDNPALTDLALPLLATAAETRISRNHSLARLGLAALEVTSLLSVSGNGALAEVDLPRFSFSWLALFQDNPSLTRLELPGRYESLYVTGNEGLVVLRLPGLAWADTDMMCWGGPFGFEDLPDLGCHPSLYVGGNGALVELDLPSLEAGSIELTSNAALPALVLPALARGGFLLVEGNAALGELELPLLTTLDHQLVITDNPRLPQCRARAVLDRLVGFSGDATLSGNDEAAPCPP